MAMALRSRVTCKHPTCNRSFESHDSMKQHFEASHGRPALQHHQDKYACKLCNRFFRQKEGLRDHMRSLHSTTYESQATEIAPPVLRRSQLHVLYPLACNDCGKSNFRTADALHQHQWASPDHTRVSISTNPNHGACFRTCSQCSLHLPTAEDLEQHFVEQHPNDGGGMSPDCLRQCMSIGYSTKSKHANTIGQYGNGFKTSTMCLGFDVLVFSHFRARVGGSPTQSIGLLSYSFLRDTSQEDIIVPMVDYKIEPFGLQKSVRGTLEDWDRNMITITKWSPYHSEAELLDQFNNMKLQGTKTILYNLWEDDEGEPELDFDVDPYDIQVRGANRDEKKIAMAAQYPNSRHYLTYRHSLRVDPGTYV